ncbi:hypothetical protein HGO38_05050 [Rhizobium sp. CG5]|nr:hypothetical protein [Rhizobium sp. CG5]MCM2472845.1 hypothetical protein [Rhizobium sp. CG5]
MSNIIDFKQPPKPPKPKTPRPGLRKALTILGVVAVFLAAWAYFRYFGG